MRLLNRSRGTALAALASAALLCCGRGRGPVIVDVPRTLCASEHEWSRSCEPAGEILKGAYKCVAKGEGTGFSIFSGAPPLSRAHANGQGKLVFYVSDLNAPKEIGLLQRDFDTDLLGWVISSFREPALTEELGDDPGLVDEHGQRFPESPTVLHTWRFKGLQFRISIRPGITVLAIPVRDLCDYSFRVR